MQLMLQTHKKNTGSNRKKKKKKEAINRPLIEVVL